MIEQWKQIEGYNGKYLISSFGKVASLRGSEYKSLKTVISKCGYEKANLHFLGERKTFLIHRLVAIAFVAPKDNCDVVNHKDGNKLNNSYTNLEWVTMSENNKHALSTGLKVMPKWTESHREKFMKVVNANGGSNCKKVIDTNTGKTFSSIKQAARELNINYQTLFAMVSGRNTNKTSIRYKQAG